MERTDARCCGNLVQGPADDHGERKRGELGIVANLFTDVPVDGQGDEKDMRLSNQHENANSLAAPFSNPQRTKNLHTENTKKEQRNHGIF